MAYLPYFKSGMPYKAFQVGPYFCMIFTDLENLPENQIEYVHAMYVHDHESPQPIFGTACETGSHVAKLRKKDPSIPIYALGLFPNTDTAHATLGWSNEWADIDTFTAKSLELVREHLHVDEAPVELHRREAPQRIVMFPDEDQE
jgi:hypothetical protein